MKKQKNLTATFAGIFLLLSILANIASAVFNMFVSISSLISNAGIYRDFIEYGDIESIIMIVASNIGGVIGCAISVALSCLNIFLCVLIFKRVKNILLSVGTAVYGITPTMGLVSAVIGVFTVILSIISIFSGANVLGTIFSTVSQILVTVIYGFLLFLSFVILFVFAFLLSDQKIIKADMSRIKAIVGKFFWLPAVIFVCAYLCLLTGMWINDIGVLIAYNISLYNFLTIIIPTIVSTVLGGLGAIFTTLFMFNFLNWLRKDSIASAKETDSDLEDNGEEIPIYSSEE